MPESWKQEGPLGVGSDWAAEFIPEAGQGADKGPVAVVEIGGERAWVGPRRAHHLRDFARALNRAADALERKG